MKEYATHIAKWADTEGTVYNTKLEALYSSYKAKRREIGMQCMLLTYRASKDNYDALKLHIDELAIIHETIYSERFRAVERGELKTDSFEEEEDDYEN
jgi:hypothetical protein